jgi:adenylate kinase family enzyme
MSIIEDQHRIAEADTFSMFGFPGAGKETVTSPLIDALDDAGVRTNVMEVGAIVRSHIKRLTEFGRYVKGLPKGALVPDGKIIPVIQEGIAELDAGATWFFDGFPRSMAQVPAYEEAIDRHERNDLMIHLQLDPDPNIEREISEGRMRMRGEAAIANGLKPREDDVSPKARAKRLEESAVLYDVAARLREKNKLIVVDASRTKDVVRGEIFDLFQLHEKIRRTRVSA